MNKLLMALAVLALTACGGERTVEGHQRACVHGHYYVFIASAYTPIFDSAGKVIPCTKDKQ